MKCRFFGGDRFLENCMQMRMIWWRGRLGGGKTSGAVGLASWLISEGIAGMQYAAGNFPIDLPEHESGFLFDTVVICDEAWQFLDARRFVTNERSFGAFARKTNSIWLFPSVYAVDKRVRPIHCEREIRFTVVPGELWVYKWGVDLGYTQESGRFMLWRPGALFSMFDTDFVPDGDGYLGERAVLTVEYLRLLKSQGKDYGREYRDTAKEQLGSLEANPGRAGDWAGSWAFATDAG